jgi:hypothetical protein
MFRVTESAIARQLRSMGWLRTWIRGFTTSRWRLRRWSTRPPLVAAATGTGTGIRRLDSHRFWLHRQQTSEVSSHSQTAPAGTTQRQQTTALLDELPQQARLRGAHRSIDDDHLDRIEDREAVAGLEAEALDP